MGKRNTNREGKSGRYTYADDAMCALCGDTFGNHCYEYPHPQINDKCEAFKPAKGVK
jgi:hypothetical protein